MKRIIYLILVLLYAVSINAQALDSEANTFSYHDYNLPYRETRINADNDSTAVALVVLLHARHGCGRNNDAHKKADGVNEVCNYLANKGINSILLVPQVSDGREWNEPTAYQGFYMSDAVKSLIDKYISEGLVDPSKIYILGASMGGSGVWRLINDYPNFFAGAMAVSAKARGVKTQNTVSTPILSAIGSRDRMVSASSMESAIKKINKKGGDAKFVLLDGYSHGEACRSGFTTDNLDWVFSHCR